MLERGESLTGMVALFMEFRSRLKERGYVGPGRTSGWRRGLLSTAQLVIHIGTEFVELGWGESE